MNHLLLEIIVYLLIAGLIGFVLGWVLRANKDQKTPNKETSVTSKKTESEKELDKKEKSQATKVEKNVEKQKEPKSESETMTTLTEAQKKEKDKLTLIKGIGPVLEEKLDNLGVYHFDQIAAWNKEQQASIGVQLSFAKKVEREEWVKQAKELMKS
jgi:predicted flap endonuclease-1-like 5' DNA nuclease